jgi:hypothetical protein
VAQFSAALEATLGFGLRWLVAPRSNSLRVPADTAHICTDWCRRFQLWCMPPSASVVVAVGRRPFPMSEMTADFSRWDVFCADDECGDVLATAVPWAEIPSHDSSCCNWSLRIQPIRVRSATR